MKGNLLPPKPGRDKRQQRLLKCYTALPPDDQQSLLAFADFLVSRAPAAAALPGEPLDMPRPDSESVVAAMRRLTATYHMMDTEPLLNDASVLMGAHLMQGKPSADVVDELQLLFEQAFVAMKIQ